MGVTVVSLLLARTHIYLHTHTCTFARTHGHTQTLTCAHTRTRVEFVASRVFFGEKSGKGVFFQPRDEFGKGADRRKSIEIHHISQMLIEMVTCGTTHRVNENRCE